MFDLGGNKGKVVLKMDYAMKLKAPYTKEKRNLKLNVIRSGGQFEWNAKAIQGLAHYELISGKL